ncbi:MAG TPA: FtsW/RodA/SpoVE family cell cycle protein [Patescibacteria group bacterium]|nr:FtsW/RodA/SpoVE family cell cycle protein [Patescibacteria group bacterium]
MKARLDMFVTNQSKRFSCIIPLLMSALGGLGLLFVWSSTYNTEQPFSFFFKKQAFGIITGTIIFFIFSSIDYRQWMKWGYMLYPCILILLVFTLIRGSIGLGGQRWIDIGFTKFQPSELTKLFLPAFSTYHLSEQDSQKNFSFYFIIFIILCSFLLIRKQPDLGTALIITFVGLIYCWFAGIGTRFFFAIAISIFVSSPILWYFLKPYQKQRIAVFLGNGNHKKEGYQKKQAIIAIGSGGLMGKGLLQGTQNKLQFLPEGRTDFIFAVLCEEWGLCGAVLVLLLYFLLFLYLIVQVIALKNIYMQLLALGTVLHIFLSTIINISMVLGMLPIVGIPLPFFSYGISHLWITYASLGIFNQICSTKPYYKT